MIKVFIVNFDSSVDQCHKHVPDRAIVSPRCASNQIKMSGMPLNCRYISKVLVRLGIMPLRAKMSPWRHKMFLYGSKYPYGPPFGTCRSE